MLATLCILLCAAGHVVRDGQPDWKTILRHLVGTRREWLYHLSTQWARLSGGALCTLGALAVVHGWRGAAMGAAVTIGFWTDSQHGAGQGCDKPIDYLWLSVSGVTSLIPLAIAAAFLVSPWWAFLCLAGITKSGLWPLCWRLAPDRWWSWAQPTRIAAGLFGAVVGTIIVAACWDLHLGL